MANYNKEVVMNWWNNVPSLRKTQISLYEQLEILLPFANKLGLYNAADFIKK